MPTRTISQTIDLTNKSINKYITEITGGGIKVHDSDDVLNYIQLTSDGIEIFKTNEAESNPSAVSVANFGEIVRIGKQDDNYFWIDNNGIYLKNNGFSIFQIFSETLDNNVNIEQILYNKKSYLGWKRHRQSQSTYQYEPNLIQFTFDDGVLSAGDSFILSLLYDGRFSYQIPNSGTWHTSYITDGKVLQNFTYGVSKKVWIAAAQGSSAQTNMFYIQYNGTNQFNFLSFTNISSAWPETNEKHVRVSYYKNIKVYFESQISSVSTVMVGPQELSHAEIDYHSFQMIDKNGNSFLHISDLQDINGYVTDTFIGDGTTVDFPLTFFCENTVDYIVTVNGVLNTDNHIYQGQGFYSLLEFYPNEQPSSNAEIIIKYKALDTYAYTFGTRDNSSVIGKFSTTIGENLKANANHQVVIGKHNQIESLNWNFPEENKVFIIGNGTSNNPSNALTVDWKGRIECGDYSGVFKSIFNILYPIGSYYETSLPTTPISGHSFDDDNLTNVEIADCGISWFDPRVMWGGTWVLEVAGMVHVSAGTGYSVNHANDNDGVGTKDGGSTNAILASHTHTLTRSTGVGVSVSAHGVTVTQPTIKLNVASPNNTGTLSTSQVQYGRPTGTNYTNDNAVSKTNVGVSLTNNHSVTVTQPVFTCDTRGEAVANKNMQPYIVVYRWHRTN